MDKDSKQGREKLISTHALREEGDNIINVGGIECYISTHALREEGDCYRGLTFPTIRFLPTPSARRAT